MAKRLITVNDYPGRGSRSPAAQSGKHVLQSRVHRVALTGRLRVSEQRAVDLIRAAGTGAVLTLLSTPPEHRDPGLADDLFDAVLRRIVTDAPELPANGPVASAVALRAIAPRLNMLSDAETTAPNRMARPRNRRPIGAL
jgi:hypothetical protein